MYSSLLVSGFADASSVQLLIGVRNPITLNHTIKVTTTDDLNYTKESGSTLFPSTSQSEISSSVLSLTSTSAVVYSATNLTFTLSFNNYSLVKGYMIINFDTALTHIDPSSPICLVNGNNGPCVIGSSTPIVATVAVDSGTAEYIVVVNNVRNPQSTQYYHFALTLQD